MRVITITTICISKTRDNLSEKYTGFNGYVVFAELGLGMV